MIIIIITTFPQSTHLIVMKCLSFFINIINVNRNNDSHCLLWSFCHLRRWNWCYFGHHALMSSSLSHLKQRLWKILPRANTPSSVIGDWQDQQHAATWISSDPSFIPAPKLFTVWWWSEWCLGNLRVKPEFLAFPAGFASTGWLKTYLRDMLWSFFTFLQQRTFFGAALFLGTIREVFK